MSLIQHDQPCFNGDNVVTFAQRSGLRGERSDPALEPHRPVTYQNLRYLFDTYHPMIPAAHWLSLAALFNKLKRGEAPSIDDGRLVRDVRARIRVRAEA